jgi:hypothetical protein
MKIDFSTPLLGLSGAPLLVQDNGEQVPMTLAIAAVEGLMHESEGDAGEVRAACWRLARAVHRAAEVDLTPEEAALVKLKIGALYPPAVVGPAYELLNG